MAMITTKKKIVAKMLAIIIFSNLDICVFSFIIYVTWHGEFAHSPHHKVVSFLRYNNAITTPTVPKKMVAISEHIAILSALDQGSFSLAIRFSSCHIKYD